MHRLHDIGLVQFVPFGDDVLQNGPECSYAKDSEEGAAFRGEAEDANRVESSSRCGSPRTFAS